MKDSRSAGSRLRHIRLLLWSFVALAVVATAALYLITASGSDDPHALGGRSKASFGGPFTLVASTGRPFSSEALAGKPYALYFGFTRCGDTCPTTLSRLVKLRREVADDQAMQILFITVDPEHDGPQEVGRYASLFNAPIIGLTGSRTQINDVMKHYGVYAKAVASAPPGKGMEHTAIVLLFDRKGEFAGTLSADEPDSTAVAKMRKLVG